MISRILVTGAGGFVGSAIVRELRARSFLVNALVHRRNPSITGEGVRLIQADLFDTPALQTAMDGCDAVIHLVGIIRENPSRGITFDRIHYEGTQQVVTAATHAGIKRYLHMSALGSEPNAASEYHRTKFRAEEFLRASTLDWTIFRPSIIHGQHGEFMQMEAKWARRKAPPFLFMPYFGAGLFGVGGAGLLQPSDVADVARAFVDSLQLPQTVGQLYPIAGPDQMTWPQLHQICAEEIIGHRRAVAPIPAWFANLLTHILPARALPFNRAQIIMSQENNTTDLSKFISTFAWAPQPFRPSLHRYAHLL